LGSSSTINTRIYSSLDKPFADTNTREAERLLGRNERNGQAVIENPESRDKMFEWITSMIDRAGYAGIALIMFLEGVFPPIPSWLVMPLAGFEASSGKLSPFLVVLAGTTGSTASAICWYFAGKLVGIGPLRALAERYGRWLTIDPSQVDLADRWFARHGAPAVIVGRLIPIFRHLISVPAGVFAMDMRKFILFTAIGDGLWNFLLMSAGYVLRSEYGRVRYYLGPLASAVLLCVAMAYAIRLLTWKKG
jgi:membrane protein DedA with SNARE-associated domain